MFIRSCHEDVIFTRKSHNYARTAFVQGDSAGGSKLIERTLLCIIFISLVQRRGTTNERTDGIFYPSKHQLLSTENLPYHYFNSRYRKKFSLDPKIFSSRSSLLAFIKIRRSGGVDSIFESADSLPLTLNQLPPVRSDFHETLQGVSAGECLQAFRDFFSISP